MDHRVTRITFQRLRRKLKAAIRHDHLILALLALLIGLTAGGAVIVFREGIGWIQYFSFGTDNPRLVYVTQAMPWWLLLLVPTAGGLLVGLFIHFTLTERRPHGIPDVIEAYARRNGYMSFREGMAAAVSSAASIGFGASVGREGPAVHLGASLAGWLTRRLHLSRALARTVLGCGVSAAVAASFNAPIAGALFASEVIVGHYALRSFAPIVIASVAGTVLARAWYGDFPAFFVSETLFASFWEFPAFVLLGLVSAVAALIMMYGIDLARKTASRLPGPAWYHPAIAGFLVGAMALVYPQVLGVGYGATEAAMTLQYGFWMLVGIGVAKLIATALCIGFGFAGGVFSPALVIGAMVGTSYGILATSVFPDLSSGPDAYALVGMGAVAAAVLGAPISTTLIIFELTGDYALTLGVMVAVVIASEITQVFYGHSFFTNQLLNRGVDLKGEFESEALKAHTIRQVMESRTQPIPPDTSLPQVRKLLQASPAGELFVVDDHTALQGTITLADLHDMAFDGSRDGDKKALDVCRRHAPMLSGEDDLGAALELMQETGEDHIAVVENFETLQFIGCVHHRDVMSAYNRALAQSRHEEHDL